MADPIRTLYSSKYALGTGKVTTGQYHVDGSGYARPMEGGWTSYRIGRDVHEALSDALEAANAARHKKIASLNKQIAKLTKMNFGPNTAPPSEGGAS